MRERVKQCFGKENTSAKFSCLIALPTTAARAVQLQELCQAPFCRRCKPARNRPQEGYPADTRDPITLYTVNEELSKAD